jgi:hypothetical protein
MTKARYAMNPQSERPTIASHGWTLASAEERAKAFPDTFCIPARLQREALRPGHGAKLLFDIETREAGEVIDRGIDRMWVIVRARIEGGYVGVLDSDPGAAENLRLTMGDTIFFNPEHIAEIACPPASYIHSKYGAEFLRS